MTFSDPHNSSIQHDNKSNGLSRRGFLRIIAGLGIAGITGQLALDQIDSQFTVQQTRKLMGTLVNLTLVCSDNRTASSGKIAIERCFDKMTTLEALLSHYRADSQVSRFNRDGYLQRPHSALLSVVQQSIEISDITHGGFDITIEPLISLYRHYQDHNLGLPPGEAIEKACRKIGYRNLNICEDEVSFVDDGMQITLDGIAKGYIVDAGVSVLRRYGIQNVLVEAGGDLIAMGQKDNDVPWKIGIQSPRESSLITRLNANDQSVGTSGDYLQFFSEDYSQHHIMDPRTGYSSSILSSATVIAPSLALADSLATALMVMDIDEGTEMIRTQGLHAFLVTKDLRTISI